MRILQVHNRYRETGGEDVVADQEAELLSGNHTVDRWIRDNSNELRSPLARLRLPFSTHYSARSRRMAAEKLAGVDVMHVHNFFPLFTPAIFDAARQAGVPAVLTLHNYRLIHPGGTLFHHNRIDERSVKGSAWACVKDGVYRESILQTAVVAHMIEYHRRRGTWDRVPTFFIALTQFAKKKLAEGGLPEERILVKPNFVQDPAGTAADRAESTDETDGSEGKAGRNPARFLFVGRLSPEKGIRDLIDGWAGRGVTPELRIAGTGPEGAELKRRSAGNPKVRWLGRLSREEVLREMAGATALLFPSRCYEGFPLTLLEAFSTGCPAVVTGIGSQAEIVVHEHNGLHVPPGNPGKIADAVRRLACDGELTSRLSRNARQTYLDNYTPEVNYQSLLKVYEKAIKAERGETGKAEQGTGKG
ncbi:MAG: glycosyltransferase family 4 protein [Balneolaceae bacterium]